MNLSVRSVIAQPVVALLGISLGFAGAFWGYTAGQIKEYKKTDAGVATATPVTPPSVLQNALSPEVRALRNERIDGLIPFEPLPYELSIELESFFATQKAVTVTAFEVDSQVVKGSLTADPGAIPKTTAGKAQAASAANEAQRIPISLTVEGTFPEIRAFIDSFQTMQRYISIDGITLASASKSVSGGEAITSSTTDQTATITGNAFYARKAQVEGLVRSERAAQVAAQ